MSNSAVAPLSSTASYGSLPLGVATISLNVRFANDTTFAVSGRPEKSR